LIIAWVLLGILVAAPLAIIASETLTPSGLSAWRELTLGRLAEPLLWRPLAHTMALGIVVAIGAGLLGGTLALLCVLTDLPFRRTIGVLAALPIVLPGFATAMAWQTMFANDRAGAALGVLAGAGLTVPDWLAWGALPTALVLTAQYYALAFAVVAAALSSFGADLIDAARIAGARGLRLVRDIVMPMLRPALIGGAMLAFAGAVSNFATPALLGIPVRFHTLSTRLFGLLEIGQSRRAVVLAVVLLAATGFIVWLAQRVRNSGPASLAHGRPQAPARLALGAWRWPAFLCATTLVVATGLAPILVLVASSVAESDSRVFTSFTWRHWISIGSEEFGGILLDEEIWRALRVTVQLGAGVAFLSVILAVFIARVLHQERATRGGAALTQFTFAPLLVPDIVFATAYLLMFAGGWSPIPLYGTFALLLLAMTAHLMPYAVESVRAAIGGLNPHVEEAARLTRAGSARRLTAITLPLLLPGLLAGAMMVFAKTVRDIALVIVLFTPTTAVLSIVAFRFSSEGQQQAANAVTLLILLIAAVFIVLAQMLEKKMQVGAAGGAS
jgi:iron(III) transport system permease protein